MEKVHCTVHRQALWILCFHVICSLSFVAGLNSCGIDCDFLIGQGYDGAANMAGRLKGAQTIIRSKYPKALYVHCAAHSLNLAVSSACNIQSIRNCLGVIEKCYCFFNFPKRNNELFEVIDKSDLEPKVKTLKRLCATRLVQRYDAINDFTELFPCVVTALDNISEWKDGSTTDASMLLKAMDSEFLISLQVIKVVFSFGLPLCKQLQKKNIDLKEMITLANLSITVLENLRKNVDEEFKKMFEEAQRMAEILSMEISVKRITHRQKNRSNYSSLNNDLIPEDYYRISICIPFIESFISQIKERFLTHQNIFKENISTTETTMDVNLIEENHHQHEVGSKWSPLFEDGPGPVNITARIGSTVQLNCKIQLLYDKTVTWVHRKSDDIQLLTVGRQVHSSDQRISLSFRYPNNWRLQIVYITDRDDGVYECQVATHPPTTKKTYLRVDVPTVRMSVTGTGDVTRGGSDVFYKTGSTLEIVCKVVHAGSNNGSKVSWYRGRQTISTGITERTSNDSSYTTIVSTLKIKHVQKTHSGNYTCLVGSPSASAAVTIHILNGEQPAAVHDGNSGPLVCCVAGWWLLTLCCLVLSS